VDASVFIYTHFVLVLFRAAPTALVDAQLKRRRCFAIAEKVKVIERLESGVFNKNLYQELESVNQPCLPYGNQRTK